MQRTLLVNSNCRDILTVLNIVYRSKGEMSHTSKCINIRNLNNLYLISEECANKSYEFEFALLSVTLVDQSNKF